MPQLDTTRYNLEPPAESERDDPEAWQRAVDNASAQLEHQAQRCAAIPCRAVPHAALGRDSSLTDACGGRAGC